MASETNKLRLFLNKLQDIGLEMREYINRINGSGEQQYMVAYLVTDEELKSGNIKPLYKIHDEFLRLIGKRDKRTQIRYKYFQFGRFIFLMNLYDENGKSSQHTEKRLLDANGTISESDTCVIEDGRFLTKLKSGFKRINGDNHPYNMLIFTFYIPCTQAHHQCAKLIKTYADKSGCKMTIGWTEKYETTDVEEALDQMTSENATVMQLFGAPQIQRGPSRIHPQMTATPIYYWPPYLGEQDINWRNRESRSTDHALIQCEYDASQPRYDDPFYSNDCQRNSNNFRQNYQMYNYPARQNRSRF